MPDDTHPFAIQQGFDDLGADRHAADVFNFAAGDGLAVGNQRQGFQQSAGITLRALLPEPSHPGAVSLAHLQAPAAGNLAQLDRPPLVTGSNFFQRLANVVKTRHPVFIKEFTQTVDRQRATGSQQGGFNDVFNRRLTHPLPSP